MKKGILIIFDKNDFSFLENESFKLFLNKQIRICLINNGNHNKILNLRKEKTLLLAVKAGVRFLYTIEDLNLIAYTKPKDIFNKKTIEKLVSITDLEIVNKKKNERVLLRNVHALNDIINC